MKHPNEHLSALTRFFSEAKAVSFDFFDTLYIRKINNPEHVFELIGNRFGVSNFSALRKAAQSEAFQRMHVAKKHEITLEGVYECLRVDGANIAEIMRYEYEVELALLKPNPELFEIFSKLVESGKTVVITSDMYFSEDFFRDALRPYGLDHLPLFISAERNATKRDCGELYDLVAGELDLSHGEILHVGDNPVSDVERAEEKGIVAYHYIASHLPEPDANVSSLVASIASGLLRSSTEPVSLNSYEEFGYRYGGPAVVGFLDWILDRVRIDKIDCVFFLSRDGYVLEQVVSALPDVALPKYSYFHGSRIAFTLASVTEQNFDQFIPFLLSGSEGLSPAELLERIGVPPPDPSVMNDLGLGHSCIVTGEMHNELARFLRSYKSAILKVCKENRRGLFHSVAHLGVDPGSRIALVDVGWSGTTQEAFCLWSNQYTELDVYGYYFCLADRPEKIEREKHQKMSALISSASFSREVIQGLYDNRVLIELFFSAPHNSVIGYKVDNNQHDPVEAFDIAKNDGIKNVTSELAKGVKRFAKDYHELRTKGDFSFTPEEMAQPLIDLALSGTWRSNSLLTVVKNFDAWAGTRNKDMYLTDY
jgi:FMN phosphatase YigB (HAD superfamily)